MKLTRALTVTVAVSMLAVPAIAAPRETANTGLTTAQQYAITPIRGGSLAGIPAFAKPGSTGGTNNGINYNGGAVMTSGVNAYLIWYGDSWTADQKTIISDFLSNIGGSPYYKINTTYYKLSGTTKVYVSPTVTSSTQVTDSASQGKVNLSDTAIQNIVTKAISTDKSLPADPNGLYFVLTGTDVSKSGFLTSYCGWHTYASISGTSIKYSFVGNPGTSSNCAAQTTGSPNGDVGVDAMISVIAHELEEAATDPELRAWYDSRGYENADKCAWTFGTTYTSGGGKANMQLGTRDYLIQRNWVNASGGYCSLG